MRRRVDAEFRRNQKLHRRRMQCRLGCTDCCGQLFSIHEMEAERITEAFRRLAPEARVRLADAARNHLRQRDNVFRQHGYVDGFGNLPQPGRQVRCPALVDGACAIYDERPLLCRKLGMPVLHPRERGRIAACELNFESGEQVSDPLLVQIQSAINKDWIDLQADYEVAGGEREELPLTVADAILRAFSEAEA